MHQIQFRPEIRPIPRLESLKRSQDPLTAFEGLTSKGGKGRRAKDGTPKVCLHPMFKILNNTLLHSYFSKW